MRLSDELPLLVISARMHYKEPPTTGFGSPNSADTRASGGLEAAEKALESTENRRRKGTGPRT